MAVGTDPSESDLKKAIERFATLEGGKWTAALEPILLTNHARGRVRYFLDHHENSNLEDYIRRVADYYEQLHEYIHQVQQERRADVWEPIFQKLHRWAFGRLRYKGYPVEEIHRRQHHVHCATESAMRILRAHFPYDTGFDPWAFVIVEKMVNKHAGYLWEESQKAQNTVSVDQWEMGSDNLRDLIASAFPEQIADQSEILEAITRLPSLAQRQLILRRYFEGWSFKQIAAEQGKTVNAIYRLHFAALANLRKILESKRDIK